MSNHPTDHRDMLQHVEVLKGDPIVVKKPEWIAHDAAPSAPATPIDGKKKQISKLLVHNAHTPSNGSFTPGSAPYKEDGSSVWERDGTAMKKKKLCFPNGETKSVDADEEEGEERPQKENDSRWNIKRRSPVKTREGEFEKDFRSRKSYSGRKEEGEEEEEKEEEDEGEEKKEEGTEKKEEEEIKKEEKKNAEEEKKEEAKGQPEVKTTESEKKVKVPKHLVSGPLW